MKGVGSKGLVLGLASGLVLWSGPGTAQPGGAGWQMLAELDGLAGDRVVRSYVWGPDVSGAVGAGGGVGGLLAVRLHDGDGDITDTFFVARDAGGNVTALVDRAWA